MKSVQEVFYRRSLPAVCTKDVISKWLEVNTPREATVRKQMYMEFFGNSLSYFP